MEYWHMKDAAAPGAMLADMRDSGLTLLIEYFSWWRWRVDLLELLHYMAAEGRQLPAAVLTADRKGLSFVGIWVRGGDAMAHLLRPREGALRLCFGLQCPTGVNNRGRLLFLAEVCIVPVGVWSHPCGHLVSGACCLVLVSVSLSTFTFARLGEGQRRCADLLALRKVAHVISAPPLCIWTVLVDVRTLLVGV